MKKNDLLQNDERLIRVLKLNESKALIIDCLKQTMPQWVKRTYLDDYADCSEQKLLEQTNKALQNVEDLDARSRKFAYDHYTLIAGVLPFVSDKTERCNAIEKTASFNNVSKQTVRHYLWMFLVYQDISALIPKQDIKEKTLTKDEKNFRWALNKFFYSKNKNSLKLTYTLMLREKYCDDYGVLPIKCPTFNQFRYFYRKHKNMQTFYISRYGIKNYQRNHRPLLGDGVQEFASNVGIGMLDSTVCDIYLINESGNIIGRPILTACIDAYSELCCGYFISWEGGIYSLRGLMLNIIADKAEHCKKYGILIQKSDWNCEKLPAVLVTDMGAEYKSQNFEQITELGVKVINLPSFRPELKGSVEKFFDLIQDLYKPYLKGKGVIESDYRERGAHDYRKDACLTPADFEKVILRCILYYNSQRVLENYPYTEKMINADVQPYANCIWEFGKKQDGANLIAADKETLILTLLPRTKGRFARNGLKVNKMRYKNDNYTEKYLAGGEVTAAYNPDDVSCVWLIENGNYIRFELIESRYMGKPLSEALAIQDEQKFVIRSANKNASQAKIDLASHIISVAENAIRRENVSVKGIRNNRQTERRKAHIDYVKIGEEND